MRTYARFELWEHGIVGVACLSGLCFLSLLRYRWFGREACTCIYGVERELRGVVVDG